VDVCSRREQLRTRATLPRFPSSSSFSSSFSFSSSSSLPLPSRGRSTNPGSSVIPRALSGSRTCLASGDSLIRSTFFAEPAGSACRRSEVPRDRVVRYRYIYNTLRYIQESDLSGYANNRSSEESRIDFILKKSQFKSILL